MFKFKLTNNYVACFNVVTKTKNKSKPFIFPTDLKEYMSKHNKFDIVILCEYYYDEFGIIAACSVKDKDFLSWIDAAIDVAVEHNKKNPFL